MPWFIQYLLRSQSKSYSFSQLSLPSGYVLARIGTPVCGAIAAIAVISDALASSPAVEGPMDILINGDLVWLAVAPLTTFVFLLTLGARDLSHWGATLAGCASFSAIQSGAPLWALLLAPGLSTSAVVVLTIVLRRSRRSLTRRFAFRSFATLATSAPFGLLLLTHVSRAQVSLQAPDTRSASILVLLTFSAWRLLRPASGRGLTPSADDIRDAQLIAHRFPRSDAGLMLMGDKSLLFSASRSSFLAYAKYGRTWVALYDPVGPRNEWPALLDAFIELAKEHSGTAAFYQVRPDSIQMYVDAGLTLMKVGEEAWLDLDTFSVSGARRSHLRYALKRGEREGLTYRLVSPGEMSSALPSLRAASNAWLHHRKASERCFSIAAFDESFVKRHSAIVVSRGSDTLAFATYMTSSDGSEATTGVMRVIPSAPACTMEYLFTHLSLELKAAGFSRFSLGVAPFSGIKRSSISTSCNRIGYVISRHGGSAYNFRGLRSFKEKFSPRWTPRYLAASGRLGLYRALAALPGLTAGKRS
ncbi:transmembrane protein [Pandoraea fibrosis]|uniref:Transmembrane protein n=2 Tax=Pandoraea fibrosis TaxID=1891094 RepID=A0A5E4YW81_9BURK|nr:transmembrane protein [Pandoraea fibrosis]